MQGDSNVWLDDCVEVLFDTNQDNKTYYQVIVNSKGIIEARTNIKRWQPRVRARSSIEKDRWMVEMAIPFRELFETKTGEMEIGARMWGFSLGRERQGPKPNEYSTWSGIIGGFTNPEGFGELSFGSRYIEELGIERCTEGGNRAEIKVRNAGSETGRFFLECQVESDKPAARAKPEIFSLRASEHGVIPLLYDIPRETTGAQVTFTLFDAAHRQVLGMEKVMIADLLPPLQTPVGVGIFYLGETSLRTAALIKIGMSDDELKQSCLVIALRDRAAGKLVRSGTVKKGILSRRIDLNLNIADLPEGEYELVSQIMDQNGKTIGQAISTIRKIPGPLD